MLFNIDKFKRAAKGKLEIENYEIINLGSDIVYVDFKESNVIYIKAPLVYKDKYNCINIYHGDSSKNGYWWDGELDYNDLVNKLLQYV